MEDESAKIQLDIQQEHCTFTWGDGWSGDHQCMKLKHDDPFHTCKCDATKFHREHEENKP